MYFENNNVEIASALFILNEKETHLLVYGKYKLYIYPKVEDGIVEITKLAIGYDPNELSPDIFDNWDTHKKRILKLIGYENCELLEVTEINGIKKI